MDNRGSHPNSRRNLQLHCETANASRRERVSLIKELDRVLANTTVVIRPEDSNATKVAKSLVLSAIPRGKVPGSFKSTELIFAYKIGRAQQSVDLNVRNASPEDNIATILASLQTLKENETTLDTTDTPERVN